MENVDQTAMNGLHSGTIFYRYEVMLGEIQYHEDPETGQAIVIHSWYVPDGTGCVAGESEVLAVYLPIVCLAMKEGLKKGILPKFNEAK